MKNDSLASLPEAFSAPRCRLSVNQLSTGYAGRGAAVSNVSLEAAEGQLTALVGPNGCGKSTLLKTIARILKPWQGEVLLDGQFVHGLPTKSLAKKLALLPQGPVAPEGLTVRELVSQGRFPHQSLLRQWTAADQSAVEDAMVASNVSEFADRRVESLSGGQRQRCWIAMVLAQEAEVMLLDEPTTFLDLKVQLDLMKLLRRIARTKKRTLVVVLHELNLASMFADQIIMMREGCVIAQGPPNDVITPGYLSSVFDLDAQVIQDQASGSPICVPVIDDELIEVPV